MTRLNERAKAAGWFCETVQLRDRAVQSYDRSSNSPKAIRGRHAATAIFEPATLRLFLQHMFKTLGNAALGTQSIRLSIARLGESNRISTKPRAVTVARMPAISRR